MLAQILGTTLETGHKAGPLTGKPSPNMIREMIRQARQKFVENSMIYVEKHLDSVRAAYAAGEFDTVMTHSEWALEHMSDGDGERLIEPVKQVAAAAPADAGPRVMIGVQVGGVKTQPQITVGDVEDGN